MLAKIKIKRIMAKHNLKGSKSRIFALILAMSLSRSAPDQFIELKVYFTTESLI